MKSINWNSCSLSSRLIRVNWGTCLSSNAVIDQFSQCFSETPGSCDLAEHEIPVTSEFKPNRCRAYKATKRLKPAVPKANTSTISFTVYSPVKKPDGKSVGVRFGRQRRKGWSTSCGRLTFVNKFTSGDCFSIPGLPTLFNGWIKPDV